MAIPLHWEAAVAAHHLEVIHQANRDSFLVQALHRVYPQISAVPEEARLSPLAVGGAMAVYKLTLRVPRQPPQFLVGKIPHSRRIVYASSTDHQRSHEATQGLLCRLVTLADRLTRQAPGLLPRSGGVWCQPQAEGRGHPFLIEEFIPGVSVERLKHLYDEQLTSGHLSLAGYQQRRSAVERLAVAAFIRLWNSLGRHTFTSDPSPWNVLIRQANTGEPPVATIIDLHSLEDHVRLAYVVQRLAAVYGMRQTTVEQVIVPGICDALGRAAGRALLQAELPYLEAYARQTYQNLGVDLHQPLLSAIRNFL